jgi:citrate synthase
MSNERYFWTAKDAAEALGVTKATLYAYTSRGQLRSEPVPGQPRERRYYREDIDRLRERKEMRQDPGKAAARGLHWGSPVLDSGITLIQDGHLYYRGQDALKLAESASLEDVAALLWEAEPTEGERLFGAAAGTSAPLSTRLRAFSRDALTRMQASLPVAGAADRKAYDLRPAAVRQTGARIVRLLTSIAAGKESGAAVHSALAGSWAPRQAPAANAIRTALVLSADNELNVSAFAARCAASAQASPYDVVSAAMATLKGSLHGGASERVAALFAETQTPRHARAVLASRLRRGERIPGFGHPLYPSGDPRATLLLRLAEASGNEKQWRMARSIANAGLELLHDLPNLDFGLLAVARAYELPERAPLNLFALGRTVGWIAHAMEQYAEGNLIRPRARYTGPVPHQ